MANASNIARAAEARSHQAAHARHHFISATRAQPVQVVADSLVLKYLHGLNHQANTEKPGGPSASLEQTEWSKVKIGAAFRFVCEVK